MQGHVRQQWTPFNRLTCTRIQKLNLSVVTTRHSALNSQVGTLTLDQMSSFVMKLRNIMSGADKQRKYKVLWCAKCSRPMFSMFSKTTCPTKQMKNDNQGIVRNKGRRAVYGGKRPSAQVGLLAKAFHNGDQFVTGTLEYLDSVWSDYKGGCVYRQHRWLSSPNIEGKEEELTIDLMVQHQHRAEMIFYEFVICSIALRRESPESKLQLTNFWFLFAATWRTLLLYSLYSGWVKATWTLMRRWMACSVLAISKLTCSEVKILVSPSVRANLVTLAIGEFNAGDGFISIDASVYI